MARELGNIRLLNIKNVADTQPQEQPTIAAPWSDAGQSMTSN